MTKEEWIAEFQRLQHQRDVALEAYKDALESARFWETRLQEEANALAQFMTDTVTNAADIKIAPPTGGEIQGVIVSVNDQGVATIEFPAADTPLTKE